MLTKAWLRWLKATYGLEVIVKDIEVALKCHNMETIGAACIYGCTLQIGMEEKLEDKRDIMHNRLGLQNSTELPKYEKERSKQCLCWPTNPRLCCLLL